MKKLILIAAFAVTAFSQAALAQTNIQMFYDFGKDRKYVTTTVEGFYGDKVGDTFFFIDLYYANRANTYGACNGAYFELERSFCFWKESALKDLSVLVEYDGSAFGDFSSSTFDFGPKYTFHSQDWSKFISVAVVYDVMFGAKADVPIKVTGAWCINNLFGAKGLIFKGFYDFWGLNSSWGSDVTKWSFLSEPQIWYNCCKHLDVGTEIECSVNFAGHKGFMCNPCLGVRYTF